MKTSFLVRSLLIFVFILLVCVGCQGPVVSEPGPVVSEPGPEGIGKEVVQVEPVPEPVAEPKPVAVPVVDSEPKDVKVVEAKQIGAKIEFESVVVDLGEIGPKSKNPFKFKFKNVGDEPLKILNVSKVCGCTLPTWERRAYAPGESGVIKVVYTAQTTAGKISKGFKATSNCKGNKKSIGLKVTGRVVKKVKIDPERLKLAFNKENAGCPKIKITSVDGNPFSVTGFSTPGNVITAAFDPEVKSTEIVLEPKVDIKKLKRRMNGSIKVNMNHPQCKSLQVSYRANPRHKY